MPFMFNNSLDRYLTENRKTTNASRLAEVVGVSNAYISYIRAGQRRPSPEVAKRIADATGIPVLELLYPNENEAA